MRVKYIPIILASFIGIILLVSLIGCSKPTISRNPSPSDSQSAVTSSNPHNIPVVKKEILVFAGSASKPALDEAAIAFEKQTGVKVYLTYGGSGTVLSQMELSKTGDIYIPGSPDYMMKAENKKIIDSTSTKIVAYLIPAINVRAGNPKNILSLSDLAKPGIKVGIGNPATVCVGLYAIEILDNNNQLLDVNKNIVTQASSCDNTATLISLKSVDAVIGWSVFHDWDPQNIDTVYLEAEQIPRLAYIPAAISNFAREKEEATAFINFLTSSTGQEIFQKWGYDVTEAQARKFAPNAQIGGEYQLPDSYKALIK
jgi:molybdate transport system substrate-binding protein